MEEYNSVREISAETKKLISIYKRIDEEKEAQKDLPKIKVNEAISRVAFVYERIRNTLEYKEKHLFLKSAIERALKRKLKPNLSVSEIAESLIREMIRARYLPNDSIPESKIAEIKAIIEKYTQILNRLAERISDQKLKSAVDILVSFEAFEIEETLVYDAVKSEALVDFVFSYIKENITFEKELDVSLTQRDISIFIAIHKALLRSDDETIRYYLFRHYCPSLRNGATEDNLSKIITDFDPLNAKINDYLKHPLNDILYRTIRRKIAPFGVFANLIYADQDKKQILEVFSDERRLRNAVGAYCDNWNESRTERIKSSVIQSVFYIFLTKVILSLILEVPYDIAVSGSVNILPLALNLGFPPAMLFLITFTTKVPGQDNTDKIYEYTREIIYDEIENKNTSFVVKRSPQKNKIKSFLLFLIYLATFFISFGLFVFVISKLQYNIVSGVLSFIFLSTVSFLAFRIRSSAKEIAILDKKESFGSVVGNFFSLPFIKAGHWMVTKFSKVNVLLFILDVIIETPFKTIIEVIEEWASFMREKREEIS